MVPETLPTVRSDAILTAGIVRLPAALLSGFVRSLAIDLTGSYLYAAASGVGVSRYVTG